MDVSRIGAKPDALLQQSALPTRETGAAERSAQAQRSEAPPPRPVESRRPEPQPVEAPEAPKPVVNTQGQTTGTRINTTA